MPLPSLHRLALPTAMDTTPPAKAPNEDDDPNSNRCFPSFDVDDDDESDDDEYYEGMPILRRGMREIYEEHERKMAGKRDYNEEDHVSTLRPSVKALAEEMTRKAERKKQRQAMREQQPTEPGAPPVPEYLEDPEDERVQYALAGLSSRPNGFQNPPEYEDDEEEEGPIYRGFGASQSRKAQMDMNHESRSTSCSVAHRASPRTFGPGCGAVEGRS